ncbi:hypothetical protein AGDE_15946 [Angomonas deanei]|uniref:Uncharacterized protein n=1 Tax=Angomonas deanei TaxID=59799 RepID=A0A7G2CRN7_9TRYP|nr:hypothetical protein AGDE_15946 [Angomonas deanei]CAD2221661.1 hypothetical protein, conserved [Angomonas deanei]|eukprot:EPY18076.1 hypothetical protein AGDE_15946 [Angomonas deanei]
MESTLSFLLAHLPLLHLRRPLVLPICRTLSLTQLPERVTPVGRGAASELSFLQGSGPRVSDTSPTPLPCSLFYLQKEYDRYLQKKDTASAAERALLDAYKLFNSGNSTSPTTANENENNVEKEDDSLFPSSVFVQGHSAEADGSDRSTSTIPFSPSTGDIQENNANLLRRANLEEVPICKESPRALLLLSTNHNANNNSNNANTNVPTEAASTVSGSTTNSPFPSVTRPVLTEKAIPIQTNQNNSNNRDPLQHKRNKHYRHYLKLLTNAFDTGDTAALKEYIILRCVQQKPTAEWEKQYELCLSKCKLLEVNGEGNSAERARCFRQMHKEQQESRFAYYSTLPRREEKLLMLLDALLDVDKCYDAKMRELQTHPLPEAEKRSLLRRYEQEKVSLSRSAMLRCEGGRYQCALRKITLSAAADTSTWLEIVRTYTHELAEVSVVQYMFDITNRDASTFFFDSASGHVATHRLGMYALQPPPPLTEEVRQEIQFFASTAPPSTSASSPTSLQVLLASPFPTTDMTYFRLTKSMCDALPTSSPHTSFLFCAAQSLFSFYTYVRDLTGIANFGIDTLTTFAVSGMHRPLFGTKNATALFHSASFRTKLSFDAPLIRLSDNNNGIREELVGALQGQKEEDERAVREHRRENETTSESSVKEEDTNEKESEETKKGSIPPDASEFLFHNDKRSHDYMPGQNNEHHNIYENAFDLMSRLIANAVDERYQQGNSITPHTWQGWSPQW